MENQTFKNTNVKRLLAPEALCVHVTGQNTLTTEYTFWQKTGELPNGRGNHYIGRTLIAKKEHNGKCVFSPKYFSWFLS